MKSFIDDITTDGSVRPGLVQLLREHTITKQVSKGQLLLRKGDITTKSYFVKQGCLRSYTVDAKGKEHIFMFAPEGWIISDMESLAANTPAGLYIDAIEDSVVDALDRSLLEESVIKMQGMTATGVHRLMKRIGVLQKRIIMLMSATAMERYEDFIATYPEIVQRVPQKMIASYLGITPEALSKIRGEMAKQK